MSANSSDREMFLGMKGKCDLHGEFSLYALGEQGELRAFPGGCPSCRKEKAVKSLVSSSNIPVRFSDCDFNNFQVELPEQEQALAECRKFAENFDQFLLTGCGLVLRGNPGTGKNHLVTAIAKQLGLSNYSVLRLKTREFVDMLWGKKFDEKAEWIHRLSLVDLVIMDEVGREPASDAACDALFQLVDARWEQKKPSIFLTNLGFSEFKKWIKAPTCDRLAGYVTIPFDWEGGRKKYMRGSGSVK